MALPSHVKATFRFHCENADASFALYYTLDNGSITQANANQLADGIKSAFAANIADCIPEDAFFQSVEIRYTSGGSEVEGASTDLSTAGTVASQSLPEHDAVCIRRRTGATGRARRGRIFFPFVPESFSDTDGTLNTTGITAYRAVATRLDTNLTIGLIGVTLVNVQPVPSLNLLMPITMVQLVENIVTRRDRQREKRRSVLGVP